MKASSKPATDKKKRILIVEDDTGIREMLAMGLEDAGYAVDQAAHAFSAICSVVRATPDLILADIRMPIVDGIGLVRELKTHSDSRTIPVVAVSGYDTPQTREAAKKAGCVGFIPKPVDVLKFPEQVGDFL